jgi:poly(hydroxyalkanoate) granule-associated protein
MKPVAPVTKYRMGGTSVSFFCAGHSAESPARIIPHKPGADLGNDPYTARRAGLKLRASETRETALEATMVTKTKKGAQSNSSSADNSKSAAQLAGTVKESAQQIWLAGLGAFSKAQEEGGKVFETLVKEGLAIQRKTQSAAEEKLSEATSRMASMANDLSSKASGQWDKLENIFEDRVSRALKKLGVPTSKDIDALVARIDELNRSVAKLSAKGAAGKTPAKKAAKRAPAKKSA